MQKNFIDKLAWIYIKDKKILTTRSKKNKDTYYIPGGKREGEETDEQALIREVKEELTVDIAPETMKYLGSFEAQAHGQVEGLLVRMTCYTADYEGKLEASAEIAEYTWHTHADREKTSPVDQIIYDYLKEKDLIN